MFATLENPARLRQTSRVVARELVRGKCLSLRPQCLSKRKIPLFELLTGMLCTVHNALHFIWQIWYNPLMHKLWWNTICLATSKSCHWLITKIYNNYNIIYLIKMKYILKESTNSILKMDERTVSPCLHVVRPLPQPKLKEHNT